MRSPTVGVFYMFVLYKIFFASEMSEESYECSRFTWSYNVSAIVFPNQFALYTLLCTCSWHYLSSFVLNCSKCTMSFPFWNNLKGHFRVHAPPFCLACWRAGKLVAFGPRLSRSSRGWGQFVVRQLCTLCKIICRCDTSEVTYVVVLVWVVIWVFPQLLYHLFFASLLMLTPVVCAFPIIKS